MRQDLKAKVWKAVQALWARQVTIECDRIPHTFHHVPLKKLLNWILVEMAAMARPETPLGWPTHLQIEPTTHCNLRCLLCPVNTGLNRPSGNMNCRVFQKIVDEMGEYVFFILLWDWGEPFLNPQIYNMIGYASERGIKLVSSTNGHLFAQHDHAERVVRSGLDTLIVALDGITQETYERYRQGGELDDVLQGIRTIVARKRALNSNTPLINLRFLVMRHNEHEIPKLPDLARSLGVDALTFNTLNSHCQETDPTKRALLETRYQEFLPRNRRYQRFRYTLTGDKRRVERNPCKRLWNNPAIHWDGTVTSCFFDYGEKRKLGNVGTDTLGAIWRGVEYRKLRRAFRLGWEKLPLCSDCSNSFVGGDCSWETMSEAIFFQPRS
jgi:radical SAM protein with 4Fe4S-binding SPASM domain